MNLLHINSYYIGSKIYKNLNYELDKKVNQKIYVPIKTKDKINNNYDERLTNSEIIYSKDFSELDRYIYFSKRFKIFKNIINNNRVNLDNINMIHAHSLFVNGGVAYKLNKEYNTKYIVAVRNTDINTFFKKMVHLRKTGIKILKNASKIIFISPAYENKLMDYIPDNISSELTDKFTVTPNGINDFWHENINKTRNLKNDRVKLVFAGKFSKNKNIINVCKMAIKLNSLGYNLSLNLIGKGPEKDQIEKYSNEFDFINLHGYMSKDELLNAYRENDIFIMPSYNETFGLVYIEAMSQGLPIIYTRGEGVDGYFKEGEVGYSVDPDDIDEMTEKVIDVINDYKDKSKRAIELSKGFSWEEIARKYINLYNSIK